MKKKWGEKNADWNRFFIRIFHFILSLCCHLAFSVLCILRFVTSLLSQNSLHVCLSNSRKLKDCRQFFFLRSYWWNSSYKGNYFPIRNRLCFGNSHFISLQASVLSLSRTIYAELIAIISNAISKQGIQFSFDWFYYYLLLLFQMKTLKFDTKLETEKKSIIFPFFFLWPRRSYFSLLSFWYYPGTEQALNVYNGICIMCIHVCVCFVCL